jgi:uncharacterized membrane protein YjgN (DUF898 family)
MPEHRYHVVYGGRLREGIDAETAARSLVRIFNITPEKAARILQSRKVVLRKSLEASAARRFAAVLQKAGLEVSLVKAAAPEDAPGEKRIEPPATPRPVPAVPHAPPVPAAENGPPAAVTVPSRIPLQFRGSGSGYFRVWIVNIILTVITLGIYSAWAKVRRKQYFYGNTRIDDAAFEYLADPKKILIGRSVVVIVFFIYSVLSELLPIVGSVLGIAFVVILPWVVVRSLTFNARNSAIRNIRFDFTGTVAQAAAAYVLWPLLAVLTLGILYPSTYYRQKRFLVENSRYGRTSFSFSAKPGDYYRIFLGTLVPVLIGIAALAGAAFVFQPAAILVAFVLYLYLFAYFSVKTTNLLYNAGGLGPHRMEASLRIKDYMVLVLVNSLATAFTLGLFHPWAKVRVYRYKVENLTLIPGGHLDDFVASEQKKVSAFGEEAGDFFDIDIGL